MTSQTAPASHAKTNEEQYDDDDDDDISCFFYFENVLNDASKLRCDPSPKALIRKKKC